MDEVTIWNIARRVGEPSYMYNESGNYIYFRTIKDKKEIAEYDKNKGILYINSDYKIQFKAIKRQIIKDYAPKTISEYMNFKGLGI